MLETRSDFQWRGDGQCDTTARSILHTNIWTRIAQTFSATKLQPSLHQWLFGSDLLLLLEHHLVIRARAMLEPLPLHNLTSDVCIEMTITVDFVRTRF